MPASMLRTALVLGLLSAVGPFAIDMYLPTLPQIALDLGTSVPATQATLTAFFLSFGIGQLVYGPWADQAGRKVPLFFGIGLFALASALAAFANSIETLVAARLVQGAGAAAVMVVPRAIIRDGHTGHEATRLMALIMLVISVSPMLAPLAGSAVMALGGWQAIFAVLAATGLLSLAVLALAQPETLPADRRSPVNLRSMRRGARVLLTDPGFMGLTFVGGLGMASFFVFISSASFVYTEQFGLTPTGFSLAFAANAIGFFGASQLAAPLLRRHGVSWLLKLGTTGFATATVTLFTLDMMGLTSLPLVIGGLMTGNAFLGLAIPTSMVAALEKHGDIAGLASSLGGTLQMVAGGLMIVATGPFFNGTAGPMLGAIALCATLAFALTMALARRGAFAPAA